jgi:phosphoesterase RecJ-like protein
VRITPDIARYLFTALSTDTGWFRHQNTTAWTFALAGELVAAGVDPNPIYDQIYESHPLPRLLLFGRSLERLSTLADGKLVHTSIYQTDLKETGAVPLDTEDLINFPRSLAGAELALLFIEQPDGQIKVSFRSKRVVDVAALAEQFGGGGHRRAAGATLPGPIATARDRVLAAAIKVLADGGL